MIEEFESGKNRFDKPNEFLLMAYDNGQLIACGGLNLQWNEQDIETRIGRVRRFYVLPKYRKHGVGKQLLQYLEKKAIANFSALCLNTEIKSAANFYQNSTCFVSAYFLKHHPIFEYVDWYNK